VTWEWLLKRTVISLHTDTIIEHRGSAGIRDEGLLESALARPQNLAAYGTPTAFDLATSYAFGIARNHPFIDGNKRSALLAAYLFLRRNGWKLAAAEADAVAVFRDLASGSLSETELSAWLKQNSHANK